MQAGTREHLGSSANRLVKTNYMRVVTVLFSRVLFPGVRCIKIPHLADAIRWHGQSWSHVAEALDVDERMLGVRLTHLHPAHRGQLKTLLAAHLEGVTA